MPLRNPLPWILKFGHFQVSNFQLATLRFDDSEDRAHFKESYYSSVSVVSNAAQVNAHVLYALALVNTQSY
jgi:hypothetical protein